MPGEEGGGAIARVLAGEVNPSGKLPVQIPRISGGQPGTYLQPQLGTFSKGISNLDPTPLFSFGHGLSYTSFAYGPLSVDPPEIASDGSVRVSVEVSNIGDRPGDESFSCISMICRRPPPAPSNNSSASRGCPWPPRSRPR